MSKLPRSAGILLPVSSLPSPGGIGTAGPAALAFADFLHAAGQRCWQVLPVGPTGFGDSPYQSFSTFAGNPYFIDPGTLCADGLLTADETARFDCGHDPARVDYSLLYQNRFALLRLAADRFRQRRADRGEPDFDRFCADNAAWLDDYALFMALKEKLGGQPWLDWPDGLRLRRPEALDGARRELDGALFFQKFLQYQFFTAWETLHAYTTARGIELIGDLPIYVAMDSADVWASPALFRLDADRRPTFVAGVPPDYFSATGQLWGNPLYDWPAHAAENFTWWKRRVAAAAARYDAVRIDHFIGIARYYSIPAAAETAAAGEWLTGPGEALIAAIDAARGSSRIIAEDLGVLHPTVSALLEKSGYPGMKVLQFGTDSGPGNPYVPWRHTPDTTVYVGTHDNDTARGFAETVGATEAAFLCDCYNAKSREELPEALLRGALRSAADTAVVQMQDWLGLDSSARMNTPSTVGGNWEWRLTPDQLTPALAERIRRLTAVFGRLAPEAASERKD